MPITRAMKYRRQVFAAVVATFFMVCLVPNAKADSLISVAFTSVNTFGSGGPGPVSGPESAATSANPIFGAASVWNNLNLPFGVLTTNPGWTGLVNSTGAPTGVGLSITGTVLPINLYPYNPSAYAGDTLRSQFIAWNSWNGPVFGGAGPGESKTIQWTISGLQPNAAYSMFVYGAVANVNRSFDMTIGGTTLNVPTTVDSSSIGSGGAYFADIFSGSTGSISGIAAGVGDDSTAKNEANWVGFQLAPVGPVPEPSSLLMLCIGLLVIVGLSLKRTVA